jgi:hypothetical protein
MNQARMYSRLTWLAIRGSLQKKVQHRRYCERGRVKLETCEQPSHWFVQLHPSHLTIPLVQNYVEQRAIHGDEILESVRIVVQDQVGNDSPDVSWDVVGNRSHGRTTVGRRRGV